MTQALEEVTQRIRERSAATRAAYLKRVDAAINRPRGSDRMGSKSAAVRSGRSIPGDDTSKRS